VRITLAEEKLDHTSAMTKRGLSLGSFATTRMALIVTRRFRVGEAAARAEHLA
jgi:hypothetical protein